MGMWSCYDQWDEMSSWILLSNVFIFFKKRTWKKVSIFCALDIDMLASGIWMTMANLQTRKEPVLGRTGPWGQQRPRDERNLYPRWYHCAIESTNPATCPTSHMDNTFPFTIKINLNWGLVFCAEGLLAGHFCSATSLIPLSLDGLGMELDFWF